MKRLFNQTIK